MAQRRMFSNRIANSAKFLQMPLESQVLYFHMILRADDDGIVESYPLLKLLGIAPDAFKVLLAKRFIEQLNEDQVVLINDWLEHNTIRADRKVDSIYLPLLLEKYPKALILAPKPRSDVEDNSKRLGGPSTDGLGKVRLGKVNNIVANATLKIFPLKEEEKKESLPFIWSDYHKEMMKNPRRHIRIIGMYFSKVEKTFASHESVEIAIKRHSPAASQVAKFTNEEINEAISRCLKMKDKNNETIRWTLETCLKELTK
jgi:hypothetical protein